MVARQRLSFLLAIVAYASVTAAQTAPLPAHPLFGSPERYPNAEAALASTLVIGSQSYPLFAQPLDVVDAWADGFEKVWSRLRA